MPLAGEAFTYSFPPIPAVSNHRLHIADAGKCFKTNSFGDCFKRRKERTKGHAGMKLKHGVMKLKHNIREHGFSPANRSHPFVAGPNQSFGANCA